MFLFGFVNAYYLQAYILGVEFTSNDNREFFTIVAQSTDGLYGLVTVAVYCFTKDFRVFMLVGLVIGVVITFLMMIFQMVFLSLMKPLKGAFILAKMGSREGFYNTI